MDYWKEAGIDPALWGGGMLGGGMSPAYTPGMSPAYAPARRSPGLAAALASGAPDPAMLVGGTDVTRDGLTAGMHSTHLGAYESRPGVWVWGPRPGGVSDDPEAIASRGPAWGEPLGPDLMSHTRASLGKMFSLLSSTEESRAAAEAEAAAGGIGGGGFGAPGGAGGGGGFEV